MKLTLNDTEIFFETFGSQLKDDDWVLSEKPTLLFIHGGLGLDHSLWRELAVSLSDNFYCIALDLRNNGRSASCSIEECTTEQMCKDLAVFCKTLNINEPILVGHSVGANIALQLTQCLKVRQAVLISSFEYNVSFISSRFNELGGTEAANIARSYFSNPTPEVLADYMRVCFPYYSQDPVPEGCISRVIMNPQMVLNSFPRLSESINLKTLIPNANCDCLFIEGEVDPLLNIDSKKELLAGHKQHRLALIEGAGHFSFITHEDRIEQEILSWFNNL